MVDRAGAPRVVVSGSFRRALGEVSAAVQEFGGQGAEVLSPRDPTVVGAFGGFVFVASDGLRAARLVQERHFRAIESADLVWVAAPSGYIGVSTAMEIQHALVHRIPVYLSEVPDEVYVREVVRFAPSPTVALAEVLKQRGPRPASGGADFLIDPRAALDEGYAILTEMHSELDRASRLTPVADVPRVRAMLVRLHRTFAG